MKRNIAIFVFLLLAMFTTVNTYAKKDKDYWKEKVTNMTEAQKEARAEEIKARVVEIKELDRSKLSSEDRKALRQELRDMNKEAKALGGGGIYISLAGILIIILLLILIL